MTCSQDSQHQLFFPELLYVLLEDCARNDDGEFNMIVSWSTRANSFKVHEKDIFTDMILPRYFRQSKYKSFARQYFHRHFMRGKRDCLGMIKRATKKSARLTDGLSSAWDLKFAAPGTSCLDLTVTTEMEPSVTANSASRFDEELYTSIVHAFDTDETQPHTLSITMPTFATHNQYKKDEMIGTVTDPALSNNQWSCSQPCWHGPTSQAKGVEHEFLSSLPPLGMADKSLSDRSSSRNEPMEDWLTTLEKLVDAPSFHITTNNYPQHNSSKELWASWIVLEPRPVKVINEEQATTYRSVVDFVNEEGFAAAMPLDGEIYGGCTPVVKIVVGRQ